MPFVLAIVIACFFSLTEQADAQVAGVANLRLIGTIQGQLGGAVFQEGSGKQFFFQLYEKLPDGSYIVKVSDDSILLKGSDGSAYEMFISHDTKTAASSAPPNSVSPSVSQTSISNKRIEQKSRRQRRPSLHSTHSEEE